MAAAFETWRRYDAERQKLMRTELETIAGQLLASRPISMRWPAKCWAEPRACASQRSVARL